MDACQLLLPDCSVDLAVSISAFEHIYNVPMACDEIHRILKPDGLAYLKIDNFTSITGSENPLAYETTQVPPWDHLREKKWPLSTFKNKFRLADYLSILTEKFDLVSRDLGEKRGVKLLTPSIRAELGQYSEEELLSENQTVIVRKRATGPLMPAVERGSHAGLLQDRADHDARVTGAEEFRTGVH